VKVLCVGNMYPPHHLGGYELAWQGAVTHLRGAGHTVRVLTTDHREAGVQAPDEPDVHRDLRWYWRAHAFPRLGPIARLRLEQHNAAAFDRHVAELSPDVVAWWAMGGMSLGLIERARRRGLPAVGFVCEDWMVYGPAVDQWQRLGSHLGPLAELLGAACDAPMRTDYAAAGRWVFISEATRRAALAARGPLPDTGVSSTGIDTALMQPARPAGWRWRLLYYGRIDPRKGITTAIEALASLPAEATLTIDGSGDEAHVAELRTLTARLGLGDRVVFCGRTERLALPRVIADADAVVFPVTWEEPWGLVPLESMVVGRPVLATGRGGSGEYLRDGVNCLRFPAGDAEGLAAAVHRLAADPLLRERLRAGGVRTASGHGHERFHAAVEAGLLAVVRP